MSINIDLFYEAALSLKLPVQYLPELDCLIIKIKKNYIFYYYFSPYNSASSLYIGRHKQFINNLLKNKGYPVVNAVSIYSQYFSKSNVKELIKPLNFPLVIKPAADTYGGEGVICNIKDFKSLYQYLEVGLKSHYAMQIEEFHQGLREYRVLMFKKRILAVVERFAPIVYGDGQSSLRELIEYKNSKQLGDNKPGRFIIDDECYNCLSDQGLTIDSVVEKGEAVRIAYSVNRARGGTVVAIHQKIPSYNVKQLKTIAETVDLELVGFDIFCEDIQKSFQGSHWLILEANTAPGLSIHEQPDAGRPCPVAKKIMRSLIFRHPVAYLMSRVKSFIAGERRYSVGH